MEVAAPRRCQLRQLVSPKATSVLAPRSTLPRHLPALAASSCSSRDGHRRVQHGVRAPVSANNASSFGASRRPPRGTPRRLQDASAKPQFDGCVPRAARVSLGGDRREEAAPRRRARLLCLHGFRTSGEIMRRQVVGRWALEVTARLDLVFADACFAYLEELMAREGPFDGLLGFSQGAGVSAALAGFQQQGLAFTGVAKVKCVIVIAGAKIRAPAAIAWAFDSNITCPSLHFIGDEDFLKVHNEELVQALLIHLLYVIPAATLFLNLTRRVSKLCSLTLTRLRGKYENIRQLIPEIMCSN